MPEGATTEPWNYMAAPATDARTVPDTDKVVYSDAHIPLRSPHHQPAWWDEIGHGSRCLLCEQIGRRHKGKIYDYRNSPDPRKRARGVVCNRCGRLDAPVRRTPRPRLLRRVERGQAEINALYLSVIQSARCSDPAVQALIRGSDGRLSQHHVRDALGGRFDTASTRLAAGIREIPGFSLRPGKQGLRSRQLVIDLNFLTPTHHHHAQRRLRRQRGSMGRARNQAGVSTGVVIQASPVPVGPVPVPPVPVSPEQTPTEHVTEQHGRVPAPVRAVPPQTSRADTVNGNVAILSDLPPCRELPDDVTPDCHFWRKRCPRHEAEAKRARDA